MKKLLISALCSIFIVNSCQAISVPNFISNKQNTKTEVNKAENVKNKKKVPFLINKTKDTTTNTNEKPVSKKFVIKNPFVNLLNNDNDSTTTKTNSKQKRAFKLIKKKPTQQVGEEMVSKEQIKEELLRVQELSQQAVAFYNDNNLEEALNTFLKVPEKYRTAQDYVLIGNILLDLEKPEDAVFMYKRAILTDEFYYKPYYNIGNICLNDDRFYMAIDYYKKAIKYAPDFAYAYYNLGCAYIKTGELTKAKSKLAKAIELKNTEPDFHYNLAYVYKKLNKPKLANIYLENYNKLTSGQ